MFQTLLIGSSNRDKAVELASLLAGLPWQVVSLADHPPVPEPEENGATFAENAVLKARYYCDAFKVAAVADDSGLVVDKLGGAPGVFSARYAGPACTYADNNRKLLQELADTPWHERTARFVCCAAFVTSSGETHTELGMVEGHIAAVAEGGNGFGYDPLFVPLGFDQTFGQMAPARKHELSHRGQAFRKLRAYLETQV
ncbi:MAG: RdgB/HAM1 family non-canonical purine NTP pyrophosphatase [Candidatus Hydrogenedentes bacterium]|nr:RdgB/HAM1 family non-canonical purine NTP pyrophosphatase [Candidatus Hydrogenedentota bacterium]